MWDSTVPDEDGYIAESGCSDAVALEAEPPLASPVSMTTTSRVILALGPVNLVQVTSAMGRGPIHNVDGESGRRLEDDGDTHRDIRKVTDAPRYQSKTSDVTRPE